MLVKLRLTYRSHPALGDTGKRVCGEGGEERKGKKKKVKKKKRREKEKKKKEKEVY